MQRLGGQQHHVVGDVDDVVDRPLSGRHQPFLQPQRRGTDLHVGEDARREPRAELRNLDLDRRVVPDLPLPGCVSVLLPGRIGELRLGDRMDLARHPVDAEAVDPVRVHLELEHRLAHRQNLAQRGPRFGPVLQHHDPGGVVADLQFRLGQDHPVALDAPQLRLAELRPVGQDGARQGHRDELARGDVGRAADDGPLAVTGVDLADGEAIGVGVPLSRQDLSHDEALGRRGTGMIDPLDLRALQVERIGQILDREAGVAVLAEPADRDLHRIT